MKYTLFLVILSLFLRELSLAKTTFKQKNSGLTFHCLAQMRVPDPWDSLSPPRGALSPDFWVFLNMGFQ